MNPEQQYQSLKAIVENNKPLFKIIVEMPRFDLIDWYVGGGCIAQTIWNYQSGFDLNRGIMDIDIAYFDDADLSYEAENKVIEKIRACFEGMPWQIDIKNEARVHLWYAEKFGYEIKPYKNCESAIDTWPTTATAVGVNYKNGELNIYAPYGLDDLFGRVVRPNKKQITKAIYDQKTKRWKSVWKELTIIEW